MECSERKVPTDRMQLSLPVFCVFFVVRGPQKEREQSSDLAQNDAVRSYVCKQSLNFSRCRRQLTTLVSHSWSYDVNNAQKNRRERENEGRGRVCLLWRTRRWRRDDDERRGAINRDPESLRRKFCAFTIILILEHHDSGSLHSIRLFAASWDKQTRMQILPCRRWNSQQAYPPDVVSVSIISTSGPSPGSCRKLPPIVRSDRRVCCIWATN